MTDKLCIECHKNKATHSLGFCEDCAREFFRERALKIEVDNPANEYF